MKKISLTLSLIAIIALSACVTRMAPFAPHRPNTEEHRAATSNTACLKCHNLAEIGKDHEASDNCLRCHRIVQGD